MLIMLDRHLVARIVAKLTAPTPPGQVQRDRPILVTAYIHAYTHRHSGDSVSIVEACLAIKMEAHTT